MKKAFKSWGSASNKIATMVFAGLFLLSLVMLLKYFVQSQKSQNEYKELQEMLVIEETESSGATESSGVAESIKPVTSQDDKKEQSTTGEKKLTASQRLEILKKQNTDVFGWVKINGTKIDYPVMFTPNEPEYYLRRNFKKESSAMGVPFLGEGYSDRTDNMIVYGHNMKDGSMFSDLTRYKNEKFLKEHSKILFVKSDGTYEYEIIAAFETKVLPLNEEGFRYYSYSEFKTAEELESYLSNIRELTPYEIKSTVDLEDKLITLSTCSYHTEEGRFAVVGKLIKKQ